ncbi:hypothetical protein GTCCBUS3UF5_33220 [Geobacillus thermoleovorans CCB_US3_UF5]|uniref:Uncharacterized protein n=1 Tax=Geobacillus thermoleovorans CCB_US3_UF5 TaxID=1111068 RepID=A0ABN4A2L0_GEOTH|nr:hypothetical protein GTCCBUS3UF5_33220 [Geobacillus thermoleovorans CCB_US3_UF5]
MLISQRMAAEKEGYFLYMTAGAKKADEHFSLYGGLIYDMIHIYRKRLSKRNR